MKLADLFASLRSLTSRGRRRREPARRGQADIVNVSNVPVKIGDVTVAPGHRMRVPIEEQDPRVKKLRDEGVIHVYPNPRSGEDR
jgi:hypothetical protein